MTITLRTLIASIAPALLLLGSTTFAQDIPSVAAKELRDGPQRYWAGYFVFSDVLETVPSGKTTTIDDRRVAVFNTKVLGEAFAEQDLVPKLRELAPDKEYLFYATVIQQKKGVWGFLSAGGEFVVIVKDVTEIEEKAADVALRLGATDSAAIPDRVGHPLVQLDEIIKDIHKDMFGYAQTQGIPIAEVFTDAKHRDKVASSARNAIRRFEDRQRTSGQEFFVEVLSSFIALQYGYAENSGGVFEPDNIYPEEDALPRAE